MKSVAVFCGSSPGNRPEYMALARETGRQLAITGRTVVYGGASIGLMGAVADGALEAGGHVIGVLPTFMDRKEIAHRGLSELILTETMHERKLRMARESEGFIALPGGFGTLEEYAEILTWGQLGLHQNPMGLLNFEGFYEPLLTLFDQMESTQFLRSKNRSMVLAADNPASLLELMEAYEAPPRPPWLSEDRT